MSSSLGGPQHPIHRHYRIPWVHAASLTHRPHPVPKSLRGQHGPGWGSPKPARPLFGEPSGFCVWGGGSGHPAGSGLGLGAAAAPPPRAVRGTNPCRLRASRSPPAPPVPQVGAPWVPLEPPSPAARHRDPLLPLLPRGTRRCRSPQPREAARGEHAGRFRLQSSPCAAFHPLASPVPGRSPLSPPHLATPEQRGHGQAPRRFAAEGAKAAPGRAARLARR